LTHRKNFFHVFDMEDIENLLALILVSLFLGGFLIVGFYMGYRYRDNLSLERQKKYRPTQLRETSRVPSPSAANSDETVESPTT
jgi:hypothetical protein